MNMSESPSPVLWSTVAALPDYLLLAQTRQLARHEQALQILVLDHLREIEARRLHLTRGYGSLFDYVVHELGYTAAAAWRRIKAMRLCDQTAGARELLQDGSLNLSNAAQLQNLFERSDRSHGRPSGGGATGGGPGGTPRNDGTPAEPAPATPMRAGARDPAPVAGPVLDAAAREELVKQAAGKSTRELQQMLAEVDPALAQPSDRMRALGSGRWELKATIDAECRHGLEKLQMLLSHQDPHLTLGALVARLVRDGLNRYDPARPRRARRTDGRGSGMGEGTESTPARDDTEAVQRSTARAKGGEGERRSAVGQDDASPATAVPDGVPGLSATKWQTEGERGGTKSTAVRGLVHRPDSAPKRSAEVEHGSAAPATSPRSRAHTASPAKRHGQAELDRASRAAAQDGGGRVVSAPKRDTETGSASTNSALLRDGGGHTNSAAKRLSYAAGHGATVPAKRSPALERHLAALSCFSALPDSRSRYIPAAVRREVWRRDQGRCSYVDRHSGRRCGSRYRLEIDHIVPFALGGATELSNLRLRCKAHHKLRHTPTDARHAPAPDAVKRGRTVESRDASHEAGA